MRIESGTQTTVAGVSATSRTSGAGRTHAAQGSQAVQSPFQVQLTNLVEKLSGVQASSGDIRPEKVADIGSRLAQGNYSISGQDIAAKLMLALQT